MYSINNNYCTQYFINKIIMDNLNKDIKVNKPISIKEQAQKFLLNQIEKKEFIVDWNKIPNRKVRQFLKANDYLYSPCKYLYIIKDKTLTNNQTLEQNYFNIVSKLWWVVWGELALNYHTGKTAKVKNIEIITPTKCWNMFLGDRENYTVKYHKSWKYRDVEKVNINWAKLYIEKPTSYLINNFNEKNSINEDFIILLSATKFNLPDIEKYIDKWANISSLSKMALWYKDNKNPRNYSLIKMALQKAGKSIKYSKWSWETEKNLDDLLKSSLSYNNDPTPDKSPKLTRFENMIDKMDKQCDNYLSSQNLVNIKERNIDNLLYNIEENVVNDSYHSLTIEQYKVSKEDIEILRNPDLNEKEAEVIEDKLAIKGYLKAYKSIVEQIQLDYSYQSHINKNLITNINWLLFSEYSKHKWFYDGKDYRTNNVEITWSSHHPTDHNLVPEYMDVFTEYINWIKTDNIENKLKRAIMTHFLFVYIHPFGDGNWRTARFLMNHALWSSKLDWITILSNKREDYISALKSWSEDGDITQFSKLITDYMK